MKLLKILKHKFCKSKILQTAVNLITKTQSNFLND